MVSSQSVNINTRLGVLCGSFSFMLCPINMQTNTKCKTAYWILTKFGICVFNAGVDEWVLNSAVICVVIDIFCHN
jgi:hypothetical protein